MKTNFLSFLAVRLFQNLRLARRDILIFGLFFCSTSVWALPPGNWVQTFNEDFGTTSLDSTKWSTGYMWTPVINHELQAMRPENVTVTGGALNIKVEKRAANNQSYGGYEWASNNAYASGCITSFGKFTQTYGYFEARIQTASGKGAWPAFWLLPDRGASFGPTPFGPDNIGNRSMFQVTGQPNGAEIDVLESFGSWKKPDNTGKAHQGFIWDYGTNGGALADYGRVNGLGDIFYFLNPDTAWHTYGMYWAPGAITFYIDDQIVNYWTGPNVPACPQYLLLNCSVGADDWSGTLNPPGATDAQKAALLAQRMADIDATMPSTMKVDWVHVYSGTATAPVPFTPTYVGRDLDNGTAGPAGSDTWAGSTSVTVKAPGQWGIGDSSGDWGRMTFKSMIGDGSIVARITRIDDVGSSNSTAGVLIREDANFKSKSAYVFTSPTYGNHGMMTRTSTTGTSTQVSSLGQTLPVWVKLVRSGNTFTGYMSADGVNWGSAVSSATIVMNPTVQIGLATSSATANLTTAIYDNITVTSSGGGSSDLALGKTVTASSQESSTYPATAAVDGNSTTRWASTGGADNQWIYVDLGSTQTITQVKLNWEVAYASGYKIQTSNNASTWTDIYSTTTGDGGIDNLTGLSGSGRYVRMLCVTRGTTYGISLYDFEVYGTTPPPSNLALSKPATASSQESTTYPPTLAVDGNSTTRWASTYGADNQWIYVDLGSTKSISHVKLNWEVAYASGYKIQTSNDASNWTDIYTTTTGNGAVDDLTGLVGSGRYVRMLCVTRATTYGISLYDFEVYP